MRILVVEDEPALREALRTQLAAAGFTVDLAADGEEGLFAGNEYPVDVAIVDLGLPKIPGLDLIRRLRAAGRTFPILVLTARDRWEDKVEGARWGRRRCRTSAPTASSSASASSRSRRST